MLLLNYLRNGGTPEELKTLYGVDAKVSERHPGLVQFKYDQIESPMGERIVQECRGVILDRNNNWNVVARPFDKFFNYGEGHAPEIDWSTARVQEKLDGSLMILYHHNGEWNVATSGNPDAAGSVNDFGFTFRDLFWKTWDEMRLPLDTLEEDCTYMWELTTPYNKVVVPHPTNKLTLIGVRHLPTMEEDCVHFYEEFPVVKEFSLNSMAGIEATFANLNPLSQEGYVVVDNAFRRVKVKHPGYVALHHLKDSVGNSQRRLLEVVITGEHSEVSTYFPEYKERLEEISRKYENFCVEMEAAWDNTVAKAGMENRKNFAILATKTPMPGYLFSRLDGKVSSIKEYVGKMQSDHMMRALKLKE